MKFKKMFSSFLAFVLLIQLFSPINGVSASTDTAAAEPTIVLVGDLQSELGAASDWSPSDMTTQLQPVVGTDFYYYVGLVPKGNYQYKVALNGTWDLSFGQFNFGSATYENGGNINLTISADDGEEVLFLFNTVTKKLSAIKDMSEEQAPVIRITGTMNSWNEKDASTQMLAFGSGYYAKELTLPAGTHEYKYVFDENWDKALGNPDSKNKTLVLDEPTTLLFVFDEVARKETILFQESTTRTATVVGDLQVDFFGSSDNWSPASSESKMNYYGNGIYYREVLSTQTKNYEYKVAMNDSWDEAYTQREGNNTLLSVASGSTIGFLFNDTTKRLFDSNGQTLNATGSHQSEFGASADWAPEQLATKLVNQQGLNILVGDIPSGNYETKITLDGAWYKNYGLDGVEGGSNISISGTDNKEFFIARENVLNFLSKPLEFAFVSGIKLAEVPVLKSPVKNKDGTITFNVSKSSYDATKPLYIIGSFNGWSESTQVLLNDEGKDYISVTLDFNKDYNVNNTMVQYKFKYATWGGDFSDPLNPELSGTNSLVEVGIAPQNLSYHVTGSFQGWNAGDDSYKMTDDNMDGIYEFTIPLASARHEYKITRKYKGAITWIPDGTNNNHVLNVTQAGDVTFYFNSNLYNSGINKNPVSNSLDMKLMDFYVRDIDTDQLFGPMIDDNFDGTYTQSFADLSAGTYNFSIEDEDKNVYATSTLPYTVSLNETFNLELSYNSGKDYILDNYAPYIDGDIDLASIYHDSWDSNYRRPFGAIPVDSAVSLSIRTKKGDASKVFLVLDGKPYKLDLITTDASTSYDMFGDTFSFDQVASFPYYFIIQDGEKLVYYNGPTGKGSSSDKPGANYTITVFPKDYTTPDWMKLSVTYQIFGDRFYNGDPSNDQLKLYNYGDTPLQFKDWNDVAAFEDTRYSLVNKDMYDALSVAKGWDTNWHNEVYGGDLAGVSQKLNYLQRLGVKTIYFNPIFESVSAHKYDSADYSKVDPRFGSNTDFIDLAEQAKSRGMNIILDGVFNHVGSDSLYFNKYGKNYEDHVLGAYEAWILEGHKNNNAAATLLYESLLQGNSGDNFRTDAFYAPYLDGTKKIESPYSSWFNIADDGKYEGWWGYDSLPVIQSLNGSELNVETFVDYIIENDDSIARQWIADGSSGWRLDVSPEVSMDFWLQLRSYLKGPNKGDLTWFNGEPIILAENWSDATSDFISGAFDSTMNYRFREAAIEFVVDEVTYSKYDSTGLNAEETWNPSDAATVNQDLMTYFEKYPKESSYVLMNLLGSHDVPRILGVLGYVEVDRPLYPATINSIASALNITVGSTQIVYLEDFVTNNLVSEEALTDYINTRNELARKRYMLASVMQMTYPGSPTIYYGEEVGMSGYHDPDNRRPFNWSLATPENDVLSFISDLAKLRNKNLMLQTGEFTPLLAEVNSDVYAYGRHILGSTDAVGNTSYITNFKNNQSLDVSKNQGMAVVIMNKNSAETKTVLVPVEKLGAKNGDRFKDGLNNKKYEVVNGFIEVSVNPLEGIILIDDKPNSPSPSGNSSQATETKDLTDEETPLNLLPFNDLKGFEWANNAFSRLFSKGIIKGINTTQLAPQNFVHRSQFATMLSRILGKKDQAVMKSFKDVTDKDWYYSDIINLSAQGIMVGNGTGQFLPNAYITRQEAAVSIATILKQNGFKLSTLPPTLAFEDTASISYWAFDSIALCNELGIIVGDNKKINPKGTLTRAEAIVMIDRLMSLLKK
jgi:glycosidase